MRKAIGIDIFKRGWIVVLTPLDIKNQTFDVKFRGYSIEEVDNFMDMLLEEYETTYKENIAAKDKISTLSEAVEHYKGIEDSMRNAIIVAQSTADELKKNATEKADIIISEANMKAEKIVAQANERISALETEYARLKQEVENYKIQVKTICQAQMQMLDEK